MFPNKLVGGIATVGIQLFAAAVPHAIMSVFLPMRLGSAIIYVYFMVSSATDAHADLLDTVRPGGVLPGVEIFECVRIQKACIASVLWAASCVAFEDSIPFNFARVLVLTYAFLEMLGCGALLVVAAASKDMTYADVTACIRDLKAGIFDLRDPRENTAASIHGDQLEIST